MSSPTMAAGNPNFEFATATRIVFGRGVLNQVPDAARDLGSRAVLVTGRDPSRARRLRDHLEARGVECLPLSIEGEPSVDAVRQGVAQARRAKAELVVAFGGGSAIDAGKAIAAMLTNPGDLLDYLEVIGQGKPLPSPSAPFIAVPTTAGTGSEVTRNAVLASPDHGVKASLRSPHMLPRLAIVDPELTLQLPPAVTARTGLDALTQVIEPFVSVRANPLTDGFCREGIRRAARSLRRVYADGADIEARTDMALTSLLSGLALANAGLGAVHGFAAPIGGTFDAPHGAVCAALLPHATLVNIRALRARASDTEALRRYGEIARILTGKSDAKAEDAAAWLEETGRSLAIPPLRQYGITARDGGNLVAKASRANSMKGNPIVLNEAELHEIISRAL